jgi:hypothetical protein
MPNYTAISRGGGGKKKHGECTGCVSESGDFPTLLFLVRQQWGGCRYRRFAATLKAF